MVMTTAAALLQICKLARKGTTPSQIGVILRDSNGIPQVGSITGSKVGMGWWRSGMCASDALERVRLAYSVAHMHAASTRYGPHGNACSHVDRRH